MQLEYSWDWITLFFIKTLHGTKWNILQALLFNQLVSHSKYIDISFIFFSKKNLCFGY